MWNQQKCFYLNFHCPLIRNKDSQSHMLSTIGNDNFKCVQHSITFIKIVNEIKANIFLYIDELLLMCKITAIKVINLKLYYCFEINLKIVN